MGQNMKSELTIYQYFIHPNQTSNLTPNVVLFGKKRRMFCEECTEYELGNCIQCNARTEVEGINSTLKCQKCIDAELEDEKERMLAVRQKRNKVKREKEKEEKIKATKAGKRSNARRATKAKQGEEREGERRKDQGHEGSK